MNEEKKGESEPKNLSRRQFAKALTGFGAAAVGGALAGPLALAQAQEEKIKEERDKKVSYISGAPYEIDEKVYKRFSGANLGFNVASRELGAPWPKPYMKNLVVNLMQGKTTKEIDAGSVAAARSYLATTVGLKTFNNVIGPHGEGLENKGWLSWSDKFTPPPLRVGKRPPDETDPGQLTTQAKMIARLVGADLVGVAHLNKNWIYSETQRNRYSADPPITEPIVFKKAEKPYEADNQLVIPEGQNYIISIAIAMNRPMIQTSPAALSSAATNLGYSRMGIAVVSLAEYIRTLGYWAIPCMNDTGLSVPIAVDAGLGEVGRNGILITPEFGPCVRLCKVITNMPMIPDKPISFGVTEFCKTCKKCARECPSKTITHDDPSWEIRSECNNPGVKKWYNDYTKCVHYWVEQGASCTNCVSVCPFTKGYMWAHDFTKWSIDNMPALDGIWLGLDDAFGYGERRDSKDMWNMTTGTYGIDPDIYRDNKTA